LPRYAELHCLSNFTFLRGASHPHELVERADALGYSALALTDECSVAGVVRAHMAAKNRRLKLIVGAELRLVCGLKLAALRLFNVVSPAPRGEQALAHFLRKAAAAVASGPPPWRVRL
jgi:error-prone DNA polymerase